MSENVTLLNGLWCVGRFSWVGQGVGRSRVVKCSFSPFAVLFGEVGQVGVVQMFSQNMNHLKNREESGVFSMHFRHM